MLRFLVVGTFRCGTAYMAQVLNRMGIACGHGWAYTPDGTRRYPEIEILGDAAPRAVPFARDFDGLVLHQVRHPLRVIGSLLGLDRSQDPLARGDGGDPLDLAIRHYVEWNARCERHNGYLRYRIEALDAALLSKIADLIGRAVDADTVARALAAVPTDLNTRHGARPMDWSDLPEGPARDALLRLAARYGYPVPEPCSRLAAMGVISD